MRIPLLFIMFFLVTSTSQAKTNIQVVTSIKPVHSLVAGVMKNVGTPYLIVKSSASPHTYNMKPSDARALRKADLIVWIGKDLETFLQKPISSLGRKADIIELQKTWDIRLLKQRKDKSWNGTTHDDHDHHSENNTDMHIWLDPDNAKKFVLEIVKKLVAMDPPNLEIYKKNAYEMTLRLDELSKSLKKQLSPYSKETFIVYHDSYQYFENYFQLKSISSITLNPEIQLGARHFVKLRNLIKKHNVRCIFAEPQFDAKIAKRLSENTSVKLATLDPIGADIMEGPELYFEMMKQNGSAVSHCFMR